MTNGNDFVPILPDFEIYQTCLSHGRDNSQVTTDVLGVKSVPKDAKLLGKFLTHMVSTTNNDQCDGIFLPKGAAYLLGPQTYTQVLQENDFFLTTVVSIPINLEYEAWFAVINPNQTSKTEPVSLHDHLLRKPWFLCIELVAKNKCLIVTTQPNLPEVHAWIDTNLETMIRKSIPMGIDPPSSLLPCQLDKPMHSAMSVTYADILEKQYSPSLMTTITTTANNQSPCKRQAIILDYNLVQLMDSPPSATVTSNSISHTQTPSQPTATNTMVNYDAELLSLKTEINSL